MERVSLTKLWFFKVQTLLIGLILCSFSYADELLEDLSADRLKFFIEKLANQEFRGRRGEDAQKAATFLAKEFKKAGLKSPSRFEQSFIQPVMRREILRKFADGEKTLVEYDDQLIGRNVVGIVEGTDPKLKDEYIVIGAHFDHLGSLRGSIYYGADDNASGTSAMLEMARLFQEHPLKRSLIFIGFDLEEYGLIGAKWFVKHSPVPIKKIKLALIMDMIGREKGTLIPNSVFVVGSEYSPSLRDSLTNHSKPLGVRPSYFSADFIGDRSDYGPFKEKEIPFLFFTTGLTAEYHTPEDTIETIDFQKHEKVTKLIASSLADYGNQEELPKKQTEPVIDLEDIKTGEAAITVLLQNKKMLPENSFQRTIVTNIQASLGGMIDRNQLTKEERNWLVNMVRSLSGMQLKQ